MGVLRDALQPIILFLSTLFSSEFLLSQFDVCRQELSSFAFADCTLHSLFSYFVVL